MRVTHQLLVCILAVSISFKCTEDTQKSSLLVGIWQAQTITTGNIKLDLIHDSLLLPAEYYKEQSASVSGSSKSLFDSLVLVELKNQFKNSVMANQVEFAKNGHFKFMGKTGDPQRGTYQLLSKNQMELSALNDSSNYKPVCYFDLNDDFLKLTVTGEKEIEVLYKRIK
jgi:hypothetical protein